MPSQQVAVREEDIKSLTREVIWAKRKEFANLLPSNVDADTFVGLAAAAMFKNPGLAVAALNKPESLIIALRDCARLGHEPGTDEYALTVRAGGVLGIEQYQGVIARMFNAGNVQAIHAEVVTKQERLERRDPLPPLHHVPNDDWLDRDVRVDNLKGAYAYAILEGGVSSRVVVMGRQQIMTHRDKAGIAKSGPNEGQAVFWDGPFGLSMWLKTVVHELEKWVPTSASYRKERARADAEMARLLGQTSQSVPATLGEPTPDTTMGGAVATPTDAVGPAAASEPEREA